MGKIDKFIRKLDRDTAHGVLAALYQIRSNDLHDMDVKKLQGYKEEYRIRIGRIRIQFKKTDKGNIITDVGFRNDNTY